MEGAKIHNILRLTKNSYNSRLNNAFNIAIDKYINKENLRKRPNEQSECDWSNRHTSNFINGGCDTQRFSYLYIYLLLY